MFKLYSKKSMFKLVILSFYKLIEKQTQNKKHNMHKKHIILRLPLVLGMTMGRGGDGFYIPRPHTRFSYTYLLPYPYSTGMRN